MPYGLKLVSADGKEKIVTPDDATIIAAGSTTMSNSLEGDNTYGEDVSLGATYNENEISVLVVPRRPVYAVNYTRYIDTTLYYATFYLNSADAYYTRNTATGVMTSFTAGNKTVNNKSTWNPVLSVFPIAFWDKMGASTFSSVRLFAATAYLIRAPSNDVNLSLAGSATGATNGGTYGVPANIKDDDPVAPSGYGVTAYVVLGNSATYNYWCQVTFSSATIYKAESYQDEWASIVAAAGTAASGTWELQLYYGGSWHNVLTGSFSAEIYNGYISRSVTGVWKGVTGIRVNGSIVVAAGGSGGQAYAESVVWELRAWGTTNSDADENKIVYSIGNQGITTVDYMVCRKRFIE